MKKRAYAALSTSTFLNGVGSNLQLGIWPFYLEQNNVGDELYGAFTTAGNLFGIFARAASAKMDSLSESLPFAGALMASTSMMLTYALMPSPFGIAIGMTLSAISQALIIVGRTTLVGRDSQGTRLATTYAIVITLGNLGVIVGINFGAVVFPFTNYLIVFVLGGLICFIGLATALIWLPRGSVSSKSKFGVPRFSRISPTLKRFYLATCLDSFSWNIALPFFAITPAHIFQVTQEDIALISTLQFGAATATFLIFGALSDRLWGRKSVLAGSELLGVTALAIYVAAPNVQPIFASAILMGLMSSSWGPIVAAYVSEASTAEELHDNVGTWTTLTAVLRVPAPLIGGYLAEHWFPRAPYLVALFLVAGTAFYIQKYLREPGSNAQNALDNQALRKPV